MTTVFMLVMFPIGVIMLFWEKRTRQENLELFMEFTQEVVNHDEYDDETKVKKIVHMYEINHFKVLSQTKEEAVVEKKHVSVALIFMSYGSLNLIGLGIYIIYFFFFKKPEQIRITVQGTDAELPKSVQEVKEAEAS
jgi:hypothetical protein